MPDGLTATWDSSVDAYYFHNQTNFPSVKQIDLGTRHVVLDVDHYGRIIGVEVV